MLKYTALRRSHDVRVLEAGCGTATFGISLALLGFKVDAFDYNDESLRFARNLETKARETMPSLELHIKRGDILRIDEQPNAFDLVFNQAVLEYFCASDRARALAEMTRVAKPHGYVAVIMQHTDHPFRKWWERIGWRGYFDQPPVAPITPSLVANELKAVGLQNVQVDGINPWKAFFFYPPWYERWGWTRGLVYLTGRALNHLPPPRPIRRALAIQIIGIGRKP